MNRSTNLKGLSREVRPARVAPGRPVGWHTRNMSVRSKVNPFYTVSGAEVVRLDCRMPRRDRNPGGAWVHRVYWYVWDLIIRPCGVEVVGLVIRQCCKLKSPPTTPTRYGTIDQSGGIQPGSKTGSGCAGSACRQHSTDGCDNSQNSSYTFPGGAWPGVTPKLKCPVETDPGGA
jgi:hypothetical protein